MDSFSVTQAALGGATLLQGLTALAKPDHFKSNVIGATVCAIAYKHYDWIRNGSDVMSMRYSDWFLTLPLLLWEFALLSHISIDHHILQFIASILALVSMLLVGKLASMERWDRYRVPLLLGGMFFLVLSAVLYGLLVPNWSDGSTLVTLILICTWGVYGILALVRGPQWGYNVLDAVNKAMFGVFVAMQAF